MMKKYFLAVIILMVSVIASAQFSEDFESYSVGDYLGSSSSNWSTWSGSTGGSEDVQITDIESSNGTKSIYFSGSGDGGPQDVVLNFASVYNVGQFDYSSFIKVESNKGAYFNFQANANIGEVWALDVHFVDDGSLVLSNTSGTLFTTTYPVNTWFKMGFNINLSTNNWDVLIDNVVIGSFSNTIFQIASIDIFPVNNNNGGNGEASFYMDQFVYNYTGYTLPNLNGAAINVSNLSGLAGANAIPTVTVRNLGTTPISSFDIEIDYNGIQYTENVTGVNIPSLEFFNVDFTSAITLIAGDNDIIATISNVNGSMTDEDSSDDIKIVTVSPIVPATGKIVLAEEGTGTWCGWCPRGAVMLDNMTENYGDLFVGIAVHNGDPMVVEAYDDALGFSSFPSSKTERGDAVDPSNIESLFLDKILIEPKAVLKNGASVEADVLKVSVSAEFLSAISGDYRLACVITEDGVTGTEGGWAQVNYYSGGGSGEMGGYESLPATIPAEDMVYDHVARLISPAFEGFENSFPATVEASETHVVNFFLTIDPIWDLDKIHIVSMLIAPDGTIDNAGKATLDQAKLNGFIDSAFVDVTENLILNSSMSISPNPTSDLAYVYLENEIAEDVSLTIFDVTGKLISSKNYGKINNNVKIPINTINFDKGIYIVSLEIGNKRISKKLIIK